MTILRLILTAAACTGFALPVAIAQNAAPSPAAAPSVPVPAPAVKPAAATELPAGRPAASINLLTHEGVALMGGQWRYSDTRIIEVDFKGPDGGPGRTYDYTPHAGGIDFDDSAWTMLEPEALKKPRSTGRICFNWYRIKLTIPARVADLDPKGTTVVFEVTVDDYAEVWVNGKLPRVLGQSGGTVVKGFNAPNRLVIARDAQPGQTVELAVFGINGPISDAPGNYIFLRNATLDFFQP